MKNKNKREYPILLYHGVTIGGNKGIENFSKKHIPFQEFKKQISFVGNYMNPVSFRRMAESLQNGEKLPHGSIAVTFDDSYKNVFIHALPILRKHKVPATFFISTGFIDRKKLYWTDAIEHMINISRKRELYIHHEGLGHYFDISNTDKKIESISRIKKYLKNTSPENRDSFIEKMTNLLNIKDKGKNVPSYEHLSWKQVAFIDSLADYEIGGHTVNHEILSYLDEKKLYYEINDCLNTLEKRLKRKIDLFSYPEGQEDHFNDVVIKVLKEAGVKACPTAIEGFNTSPSDPFHLRRTMVGFMGTPFPNNDYSVVLENETTNNLT